MYFAATEFDVDFDRTERNVGMKTGRTLHTDEEVRRMKDHVDRFPAARKIADEIVGRAEVWAELDDAYVRDLPPPADIYRGFLPSFDGCPVHGEAVFQAPGGPWQVDIFNRPWKIRCAVGGEEYPSNDFMAYYRTRDRTLLTGDYADDGSGWDPGDGRSRFWFVAHYCYSLWHRLIPALQDLGRAYLITGDARFGRKGAILLDRMAALFPTMDHAAQSWYGLNYQVGYTGRFLYAVQESFNIGLYAEAYDNLYPALQSKTEIHEFLNKEPEALIRHVEDNMVRQSVRDIWEGKIRGNYGLHQASAVKALVVIDDDAFTDWAIEKVETFTGCGPTTEVWAYGVEGWDHALDNFLFRDGVSFEVAIGYSAGCWTRYMLDTDLVLKRLGKRRLPGEHVRSLGSWSRRLACWGGKMPAIADTGAEATYPMLDSSSLQRFYRGYGWPEYARALLNKGVTDESGFSSYDDLFEVPLTRAELERAAGDLPKWPETSVNLGGTGFVILRSGRAENQLAAVLQYGHANAGHAHRDRLNLEVIAGNKRVVPDTGYPTHAAEHPDPPAWEKNTASHVTVVVNESRQDTADEGRLERFGTAPHVQHVELSASRAYLDADVYRRGVTLLELAPDLHVLVDLFHVRGGWAHDYSFHGFNGAFSTRGVALKAQEGGTLAGPAVPFRKLYDDPELERHASLPGLPGTDGKRSYHSYRGSGFSYLYDVKRGRPAGEFRADWRDDEMGLRMIVPGGVAQEIITAHGRPPNKPGAAEHLDYVLLRNRAGRRQDALNSLFAVVCEAYRSHPQLTGVRRLDVLEGEDAIGLEISWQGGKCNLLGALADEGVSVFDEGLELDGGFGVLTRDANGRPLWACLAGRRLKSDGVEVEGTGTWRGRIAGIDVDNCRVTVTSETGEAPPAGETLMVSNPPHVCNFPIKSVVASGDGWQCSLDAERLHIGRFVVEAETEDGLLTRTWIHREWEDTEDSGCHYLKGARLAYRKRLHTIERVIPREEGGHRFVLRDPIPWAGAPDDLPLIYDLGPGDACAVRPMVFEAL